jgi:peptidoglycan/xylan/chitin deacetylase (PgdA/CDA1 family)
MKGKLVISLDFELFWGISESKNMNGYGQSLAYTKIVVQKLLDLFDKFDVKVTWAVVGFLFYKDEKDLLKLSQQIEQPSYRKLRLNNYEYLNLVKEDCLDMYFAPELIDIIKSKANHEIATHTFSHYYTLERGQTMGQFEVDLDLAIGEAKKAGIDIVSIVFPRNQFSDQHIAYCKSIGINVYRGNQNHWIYKPGTKQGYLKRGLRLLDSYFRISGDNTFVVSEVSNIKNVKASRFLRPYKSGLKFAEGLRRKRILSEMTYAAKNNRCYHLWWHPHNFCVDTKENMEFLETILIHYKKLNQEYGFSSVLMKDFE